MSNEQEARSLGKLAELLEISDKKLDYIGLHPERINEEAEKKLKEIYSITSSAGDEILDGIQIMGKLMWWAGNNPEFKEMGPEFDHELLYEGGYFIDSLTEMLRGVLSKKNNAQYSLNSVLEYRLKLKEGGAR